MRSRRAAGALYVDYLQNVHGKTLAKCVQRAGQRTLRAFSTPITWEEIDEGLEPQDFYDPHDR